MEDVPNGTWRKSRWRSPSAASGGVSALSVSCVLALRSRRAQCPQSAPPHFWPWAVRCLGPRARPISVCPQSSVSHASRPSVIPNLRQRPSSHNAGARAQRLRRPLTGLSAASLLPLAFHAKVSGAQAASRLILAHAPVGCNRLELGAPGSRRREHAPCALAGWRARAREGSGAGRAARARRGSVRIRWPSGPQPLLRFLVRRPTEEESGEGDGGGGAASGPGRAGGGARRRRPRLQKPRRRRRISLSSSQTRERPGRRARNWEDAATAGPGLGEAGGAGCRAGRR